MLAGGFHAGGARLEDNGLGLIGGKKGGRGGEEEDIIYNYNISGE